MNFLSEMLKQSSELAVTIGKTCPPKEKEEIFKVMMERFGTRPVEELLKDEAFMDEIKSKDKILYLMLKEFNSSQYLQIQNYMARSDSFKALKHDDEPDNMNKLYLSLVIGNEPDLVLGLFFLMSIQKIGKEGFKTDTEKEDTIGENI